MKRYLGLLSCCLLLLLGCAAKAVPEWRTDSFNSLEQYKTCFLSGKDQLATIHFQRAIDEIKSSGDLSLLMTAYLTRSALQIAVLETPDQRDYLETAKAAPEDEQINYYLLLEGKFAELKKSKLPASYWDLAAALEKGEKEAISGAVGAIHDDLSRLVATGLAVRYRMEDEALLTGAVDLASTHGWRKPLLIYLDRLKTYYRKNQNWDQEEKIRLKMEILTSESGRAG
jgi:hypothetical protein